MTNPYSLPEWRAWVRAIREQPDCDNLRLICADWLDEHGEHERAEFIRVQCHPRYREACEKPAYPLDDMPDIEIHCTDFAIGNEPAGFFRDPCEPCRLRYRALQLYHGWEKAGGVRHTTWPLHFKGLTGQEVRAYDRGFVRLARGPLSVLVGGEPCRERPGDRGSRLCIDNQSCPTCHGTGRTPGVLRDLMRREPVTEVEVTGVEPTYHECHKGIFAYWSSPSWGRGSLPQPIYDLISGHDPEVSLNSFSMKGFPTREAARAALNRAVYEHCLEPAEVSQ